MNRHRRRAAGRWAALIVLVISAAAPELRADAYDGFDYPVGPPGRTDSFFTTTWRGGSGFTDGNSSFTPTGWHGPFVTSASGSLLDPTGTLATTGNHVETSGTHGGDVGRRLEQTLGVPGTDVWLSWLQRSGHDRSAYEYHGLRLMEPVGETGGRGLYFVGEPGSGAGVGTYVIGTAGRDDTVVSSGVPVVPNQTAFLVVHLQFREGNDLATLYVNPAPGAAAPAGGVTYSGLDMPVLNPRVDLDGSGVSPPALAFAFDELRVGDSYAAVAPLVPEPASAAAAGAFGLLLTARRRGRA